MAAIGLVGSVVPTSGVTGFLVGIIGSPIYFATPENGWAEYYHPHLKAWMVPSDRDALRAFFEGGAAGVDAWNAWLAPLAWWGSLVAALLVGSACAMVILRRQWAEHEKLVYPLAAVPIEMAEGASSRSALPDFMRGRLFWFGAALAFLLFAWHATSWFFHGMPGIRFFPHAGYFRFTRYSPGVYIQPLQFYTIGFAYFANLEVLFSIWFFFLVHVVEGASSTASGTRSNGPPIPSARIRPLRRGSASARWPAWSPGVSGWPAPTCGTFSERHCDRTIRWRTARRSFRTGHRSWACC